jgi:hypothetical protein
MPLMSPSSCWHLSCHRGCLSSLPARCCFALGPLPCALRRCCCSIAVADHASVLAVAWPQSTLPNPEWWWSWGEGRASLLLLWLGGGGAKPCVTLWEWHSSSCRQFCGQLLIGG